MLWANRGSWNKDYATRSEKILTWMEKHSDYDYTVLLWGDIKEKARQFFDKDYSDSIVRRFEKLVEKNPSTKLLEPYTGLGHDEFLKELGQSKVLLDSCHPPEHLANLEAVCMGCIPLIWTGAGEHHFITNEKKNVNEFFDMNYVGSLDRILDTENLYQGYFEALADVVVDHEYSTSYDIFIKQLKERGL